MQISPGSSRGYLIVFLFHRKGNVMNQLCIHFEHKWYHLDTLSPACQSPADMKAELAEPLHHNGLQHCMRVTVILTICYRRIRLHITSQEFLCTRADSDADHIRFKGFRWQLQSLQVFICGLGIRQYYWIMKNKLHHIQLTNQALNRVVSV